MNECKHNWEQNHHLKIYITCKICGERWNVERLVNYLQVQAEENLNLRHKIEFMKSCANCEKYREYNCRGDYYCYNHGYPDWKMKGDELNANKS